MIFISQRSFYNSVYTKYTAGELRSNTPGVGGHSTLFHHDRWYVQAIKPCFSYQRHWPLHRQQRPPSPKTPAAPPARARRGAHNKTFKHDLKVYQHASSAHAAEPNRGESDETRLDQKHEPWTEPELSRGLSSQQN